MTIKQALRKRIKWRVEGNLTVAEESDVEACVQASSAPYQRTEYTCLVRRDYRTSNLLECTAPTEAEARRACEMAMRLEMVRQAEKEST